MRYMDVRKKYQLSNTAFSKLVKLGIVTRDEDNGGYKTPWRGVQLFKPVDVAKFLTQHTNKHWSIDNVFYIYRDYFFDVHQGKADKSLYRITIHDFQSLAASISSELGRAWKKAFEFYEKE